LRGAMLRWCLFLLFLALPRPVWAEPGTLCSEGRFGHPFCIRPSHVAFDLCHTMLGEARRHRLHPGFFTRLIWQESLFDRNAISHADARGIAQFIDSTAALRGLRDVYNPAESLEASAQYLAFLVRKFGNEGLAAVAYNAGEGRAARFKARKSGLPDETINYVIKITGLPAEVWRAAPPRRRKFPLVRGKSFMDGCLHLARRRKNSDLVPLHPPLRAWGVHLGFGTSQRTAKISLFRNTKTCRSLMNGEVIDYIPDARSNATGKRYLIARIGRDTQDQAVAFCLRLSKSGCRCRVYETKLK